MGQNGVLGDEYTFSTLAKVSGVFGDLGVGKWVHGKCMKYGLVSDSVVGSSLMSMYGKCGGREDLCRMFEEMPKRSVSSVSSWNVMLSRCVDDMYSRNGLLSYAVEVFDHGCFSKDAVSWSSVISGYGLHGKGQEAVALYDKMLTSGIKPDAISVVGVLSACSRSGLVKKGLDVYDKAINVYGIEPTMEICSCVVDLLGRSGQLDEALSFIKTMRLEPGPSVWGAFVSACMEHADSKTHSFVVADKAHPASDKIYKCLNELLPVMTRPWSGYVKGDDSNQNTCD
nr:hypothetical protein [Tanacetum cinerariifolium]